MKRSRILLTLLCAVATWLAYDRLNQPATAGILRHARGPGADSSVVLLSDSYRIDRILESMQGPYSSHSGIALIDGEKPELLWVTGVGTEVVSKSAKTSLSQEFFCHANLSFDSKGISPEAHNEAFGTSLDWRLFTLVPGRMSIRLPEGFGIPVSSHEKLDMVSMSLNLNEPNPDFELRFKSQIHFVNDAGRTAPMKPLFMRGVYVMVPIATDLSMPESICAMPGTTNLPGTLATQGMSCAPPSMNASEGGKRGTNTLHWMVPPGRHTYSCDVTDQFRLPFDTTIHYATGHMHPMGELLSLRDTTTGETLLEIRSKDYSAKRGVEVMEELSFPEGVKIYKDHTYELVTTYNNRTDKPIDVMGIVYAYLLDKNFDRLASRSSLGLGVRKVAAQQSVEDGRM